MHFNLIVSNVAMSMYQVSAITRKRKCVGNATAQAVSGTSCLPTLTYKQINYLR